MSWWEGYRAALRSLRSAKLRSCLTMLGIIVGVASVVTMAAVGAGAQNQIAEQIRSLGTNVLMVYSAAGPGGEGAAGRRPPRPLTEGDVRAIVREIPHVLASAPFGWTTAQIIRGNRNASVVLWGTTADYFAIRDWPMAEGRAFVPEEEESAGKTAVLGAGLTRSLFGSVDPIGAEVRIDNVPFQIVGVLADGGPAGAGRNQGDDVFVPIATAKRRLVGTAQEVNPEAVSYIILKAASEAAVQPAREQVEALLRQRRRLQPGQESDFRIGDPAAEMLVQQGTTRTFAWLLASVASVSLVVGGISIMNIMLVSVTERTREIGLRLAVGARRRDVRRQFLLEAVTLCLLGGLIGLAAGVAASAAVASAAGWPIHVGLDAVAFAIGFAGAVGVFFGWYPARRAARLEPVSALRTD